MPRTGVGGIFASPVAIQQSGNTYLGYMGSILGTLPGRKMVREDTNQGVAKYADGVLQVTLPVIAGKEDLKKEIVIN